MEPELIQVPVELVDSSANNGAARPRDTRSESPDQPSAGGRQSWVAVLAVGAVVAATVLIVRAVVPDSPTTLPTTAPNTTTGDDAEAQVDVPPAAPGESVRVALNPTMKNLGAELVVLTDGGALVRIDPASGKASTIADIDREDSAAPEVRTETSSPDTGAPTSDDFAVGDEEYIADIEDAAPPTLWPTSGMWVVVGEAGRTKTVSPTGDVIALSSAAGPAITWAGQYFASALDDDGVSTRFMFAVEYEYRPDDSAVLGYGRRTRTTLLAVPSDTATTTTPSVDSSVGDGGMPTTDFFFSNVMSPGPMSPWVACSTPSGVYVIDRDGAEQVARAGDLLAVTATQVVVSDALRREIRIYDALAGGRVGMAGLSYAGPWPQRGWVARGYPLMAAVTSAGMIFYDLESDAMVDIEPIPLIDPARVTVSWDETGRYASWLDGGAITVVDTAETTVFRSTINDASASWGLQSVATLAKS